ncbi:MAG: histidine kinase [Bacteroidales bacterium]|nr:histidine kinase [Bacteroidales bacterium]
MKNKNRTRAILGHLRDLLLVVIIGDVVTIYFSPDFSIFLKHLHWNSFYSLIIGGFLWKGNQLVGYLISKYVDDQKEPVKALRWNLTGLFIYTSLAIIVVNYFWWVLFIGEDISFLFTNGLSIFIIEFVVTIVIVSILLSISFFKSWREAAVNEERLKKESLAYQYQALSNQVNPHFLFNSLNTLSTLVYKDQNQAVHFIKELSEVYRYVLEHKDSEVVDLSTELDFVKNYVYLQKIRHGQSLDINVEVQNSSGQYVIPMSIQMLIENAIKHNIVSIENPLSIQISLNTEYIIIKNNLQRKTTVKDSAGIGLDNLKKRYEFISDKEFMTEENEKEFIVKIPIIKSKSA